MSQAPARLTTLGPRSIIIRGMDDDDEAELRADRILYHYRDVIEWYWLESGRQGMGPRYIQAVEVPRPDGMVTLAFRPTRWNTAMELLYAWDESTVVILFRLAEGVAFRSIPCPAND